MKKIVLMALMAITNLVAFAQNGEVVLNNQNITNTVVGKWNVVSIQPTDKLSPLTSINVKGPGFGEIVKKSGGKDVAVVGKIYASNNSALVINDADGQRFVFTIKSLTAKSMIVTDGTVTLTFAKQ